MSPDLRRAEPRDADFLLELLLDEAVRPFLGRRSATSREEVLEEIERSLAEPGGFGRFVIEVDGEPAGMLGFHVVNERSRIARLERLAVHPRFRGRRLADDAARLFQRLLLEELGLHRLELEIYAFNERACAHAERVGFVREGRKRRAYLKEGEWVDTVLYALLPEDLDHRGVARVGRPRPPTCAASPGVGQNPSMTLLVRLDGREGEHELPAPPEQTEHEELTRFLDRHGPYAQPWIRLGSGEYVRYDHIVSIRIDG